MNLKQVLDEVKNIAIKYEVQAFDVAVTYNHYLDMGYQTEQALQLTDRENKQYESLRKNILPDFMKNPNYKQ